MASTSQLRSRGNVARKGSIPGKQSVAEPTSVRKFAVILLMHICKKILLVDTYWKVGTYLCGITIGSLLTDLFPLPRNAYLANRQNVFNVFFVKLGWGWTLSILGIFVLLTSNIYCCGNQKLIRNHLARLVVGTVSWYSCTSLFEYIEHVTGFCDSGVAEHSTKKLCHKENSTWVAFDISGHAFLLIHCLLTISEEAKCVNGWERIVDIIQMEDKHPSSRMSKQEFEQMKENYSKHLPYIRVMIVVITLLQLLWELMLLTTTVYFHNMPQKLLGGAFAVVCWFLSYQVWFKIDSLPPGSTGKGMLNYMKNA